MEKINISIKTDAGYEKFEVDGYPAFEMYGHKFMAHRGLWIKNGKAVPVLKDWRVSEAETGSVIVIGYENFMEAIRESEKFLKNKGVEKFFRVLEYARKEING